METTIILNDEQISDVLESVPDTKYQLFRDSLGIVNISEKSSFSDRLQFYMKKNSMKAADVATALHTRYSFLSKNKTSIHHYIRGVRTPKLSTVFAIAEILDVSPAQLLPAVPGKYIEYITDHVEMLTDPIYSDTSSTLDTVQEQLPVENESQLQENNDRSDIDSDIVDTQDPLEQLNEIVEKVSSWRKTEVKAEPIVEEVDATDSVQEEELVSDLEDISKDVEDDEFDLEKVLEVPDEEMISNFEEEDDFDDLVDEDVDTDEFLRSLIQDTKKTPFEQKTSDD